ncbi:MAG: hypothetical protein ACLFR6_00880 [Salinarchaeum sp.]
MADDKQGREKQARDATRRQQRRDIETDLERMDEPEPPIADEELHLFEERIKPLRFPATGKTVVEEAGEHELTAEEDTHTVRELIPESERHQYESPQAVRAQVQRPTVAGAMKRIIEASDLLEDVSQRKTRQNAYEKTLRALKAIEADDEDEGIRVVTDWILEQIREDGRLPSSREVRQRAAEFCRDNDMPISDNDWLGA